MRNKIIGPLFLVVLSAMLHAPSIQAESSYSGVEFRRWSAIVSDLDEAIFLYTEILGFELGDVSEDPKTSYVYEMFAIDQNITTRHAMFHSGTTQRALTVVEVPGVKLPRPPQSPRLSVALYNANGRFDEIVAALLKRKYQVLTPRALGQDGIEIGFIDTDGHLHALYEYPYKGKQFLNAIAADSH